MLCAACSIQAQNMADIQRQQSPLVLQAQGSFYVGGKSEQQTREELGGICPDGHVTMIHLPDMGIKGNSQMMMEDTNSHQIADIMLDWCRKNGIVENAKNETTMNIQEIADRMALKDLVDTFSNLADTKEIDKQVQLFTEDAEVTSYQGDKQTSHLKGRKELAERFRAFLDQFTTVYHINGQQTVKIDGDKATGIAYAQVVLVSEKNGKRTMLTQGVRYSDEYERQDGKWLISKRISHFEWSKEQ